MVILAMTGMNFWHLSFFGLHFKVARMKPKRNTGYFVLLYEIKIKV